MSNLAKGKFGPDFQISFCKILENKWHHVRVRAESFHLNGHITGFRPHTQKLSHLIKLYLHSGSERVKVEDPVQSCTSVPR